MTRTIGRKARVEARPTVTARIRACRGLLTIGLLLSSLEFVSAQVAPLDPDARSEHAERLRHPGEPNPYLSFVSPADRPGRIFREQGISVRSRRLARHSPVSLGTVPARDELEPPGQRGWNDDLTTAEHVGEFGSGAGNESELEINGVLSLPEPLTIGPFSEDDGSIGQANPTSLTPGTRERASGTIGDGPHGSSGSGSGDYDFYRLADLKKGQRLTATVTPDESSLEAKVGLYDVDGDRVFTDNVGLLDVIIPVDGTYYACIRGFDSDWPNDPFDSASGPKTGKEGAYFVTFGLDADDVDVFSVDLQAGDILAVRVDESALRVALYDLASGQLLIGSDKDKSDLYPDQSPLPRGGNAVAARVIDATGRYAVAAAMGEGAYRLSLFVRKPARNVRQVLFLDFDGAVIPADSLFGGKASARLTPFSDFLQEFGLDPTPQGSDEQVVVGEILRIVDRRLVDDVMENGLNRDFELEVLSGIDSNDPFGAPGVSRVIIGGTRAELGLEAIGVAESIDVGNFAMEETAVVLLDRLSNEAHPDALHAYGVAAGYSRAELVGRAIGTVVVHEAGHLFGNFHTGTEDSRPDIMDHKRPFNIFFGVGADSTLGTSDDQDITFGLAPYSSEEYFTGMEDTRNTIAFGLSVLSTFVDEERSRQPVPFAISPVYPNPVHGQARLRISTAAHTNVDIKMYDAIGRFVGIVFRGYVPAVHGQVVELDSRNLSSGTYLLRASDGRAEASTLFVVAH